MLEELLKEKNKLMTDMSMSMLLNKKMIEDRQAKQQKLMKENEEKEQKKLRDQYEATLTEEYVRMMAGLALIGMYTSVLELELEDVLEYYKKMKGKRKLKVKVESIEQLVDTVVSKSGTIYDKMLTALNMRGDSESKSALITMIDGFTSIINGAKDELINENLMMIKYRKIGYETGKRCIVCRKLYSKTDPCPIRHQVVKWALEAGCYGAVVPASEEERSSLIDEEYIKQLLIERDELEPSVFTKERSIMKEIIND